MSREKVELSATGSRDRPKLRFGKQLSLFPEPQLTRLPCKMSDDLPTHRRTLILDGCEVTGLGTPVAVDSRQERIRSGPPESDKQLPE